MLEVVHIPTNTVVASFLTQKDAEATLAVIETEPATHEIIGEPEAVITDGVTGE